MRRDSRALVLVLVLGLVGAATPRGGRALAQQGVPSPQERKRDDILRALGLEKKPPSPPAESAPPPAASASTPRGPEPAAATPGAVPPRNKDAGASGPAGAPPTESFARVIHPQVMAACKVCHTPGGTAGASAFLLHGELVADHHAIVRFVDVHSPATSVLLEKAAGTKLHGGGAPWPASSPPYRHALTWIREGARLGGGAQPVPVVPPVASERQTLSKREPRSSATPLERPRADASDANAPPGEAVGADPVGTPSGSAIRAGVGTSLATRPRAEVFATDVHPLRTSACGACHRPGGTAAMTRFSLSGVAAADEAVVRGLVDPQAPERGLLLTKAAGQLHGGGAVVPPGDPRREVLVSWIRGLAAAPATDAAEGPTARGAAAAEPGLASETDAPALRAAATAGDQAASQHAAERGPPPGAALALPLGFLLNGRFSLDYERRQFTGDPLGGASTNALRSHHHYLFLSRAVASEPCGLAAEILTLQFWEAHCRVSGLPSPLRLTVSGGKIVVPFGADPLYHQSYGGLAGIDQQVLPIIWAIEGVAAHLVAERRALVLTDDLFVIRGYGLAHADGVLNLQNDFSAVDQTRVGWGNRLGVSWMFASAWYSVYFNPLGFGRHLLMQALDVTVWRPRGIPVLQHFSLGLGLLRADVSGGGPGVGGPGLDYYDFADYLQVRYHPTDWLYVQYRTGLRTFDNRRGLILDKSRLTSADASTHNVAVVARHGALTAGLYYFINLEKVDEVPNDLLRLSVIYEL